MSPQETLVLNRFATCSIGLVASASIVASVCFSTPAFALADTAPVRIEHLVSDQAVLVMSVPDYKDFEARLRRTSLWSLFETESVQAYMAEIFKSTGEDRPSIDETLKELGLERDDLVKPEGTIAGAILAERDEETDQMIPVGLNFADFGANADKAEEMFDAVITKLTRDDGAKVEEREIRGRKVRSIELPKPEVEEEEEEGMGGMDEEFPGMEEIFSRFNTLHFARDGSRYFLASSLLALEDAFEVIDGQKLEKPLADNKDFQAAMAQLGDDRQGWAVLLTPSIQPLVAPLMAGPGAMVMPYIAQLFGDIRAYGFGLGLDGRDGMANLSIGMHIPGDKVGLMSLITAGKPKGDIPSFVGSDTIGFARMNVRFARIMPLVRDIVKGLPPMFAEQIDMSLQQFGPMLDQAFAEMGPEIYVASSRVEPINEDSQRMSVTIRAAKLESVKPMFDMLAPAMGLAPQDFLGNTVFADEFSPEVAVGVGGGWVALGSLESVEGVLRSVGQKGESALAEEKFFRRGLAALPEGELVGWGYNNMAATWRSSQFSLKSQIAMLKEFGAEMGDDEGPMGESMKSLQTLAELSEKITPELIGTHVGPSVWSFRGTTDGFLFRSQVLAPEGAAVAPKVK